LLDLSQERRITRQNLKVPAADVSALNAPRQNRKELLVHASVSTMELIPHPVLRGPGNV
jgi:hypothetical protein